MNLVVLRGRLSGAPLVRQLSSGALVASFELVTHSLAGERLDVPVSVAVSDGPDLAAPGDEVVVLGVVRRRFFRVGGVTQSRTEVVAAEVMPVSERRRIRSALQRCSEQLGSEAGSAVRSSRDGGQRRPPR